jgi:hypothetical protein
MPIVSKTRLAKRKLEMQELRKENQTSTSKKHDKKCLESKNVSETTSLKFQFESLKQKYDALDVVNKKNVEAIGLLKETIKHMENQKSSKELVKRSISVQTEQITCVPTEEIMFCNVCEYPAEDLYDLGEHMFEFHAKKNQRNARLSLL